MLNTHKANTFPVSHMNKFKISLLLQCLVFLIPVNIYVIGDWLGTGVQWVLFRYQQTYLGNSLILITREITFVLSGTISGRSAISITLWAIGVFLFIVATFLVILANFNKDSPLIKKASFFTIAGGIIIAVSTLVQYGFLLNSPSGFVLPVGIPIILIIGWWMYQETDIETDDDHSDPE
jgi:hypothetical protein